MKKPPFVLQATALALAAATAVAQVPAEFSVSGTVKNAPAAGKAYLQALNERGFPATLDSAVVKNGTFSFKNKVAEGGGFYQIALFNRLKVPLLLEGGEVLTLEADANAGPNTALVKGSTNMEFLGKINQFAQGFQEKAAKLNTEYEAATAKKNTKRQAEIKAEFDKGQAEVGAKIKAMIPEMGTSLVALYATNFLSPEENYDTFAQLADRFAKEKPNARMAQAFVAQVRRMQAQKEGLTLGKPAPEIVLKSPDDKVVPLSSLKGKYVLIDFWASWCGPCRRENPNVVRMYEKYKDKGFEIYGVSLDRDRASWLAAIKADNLTWTHVSDLNYWNSAAAVTYGVQGIPYSVLVDPQGNIVAKELRGEALEQKLAEVLKQ